MKYIVTGGTGMVGRHLQEIMPNAIYLSSKDCDLTDYRSVLDLFKKEKPDAIIHLAAKVGGILQNMASPADFYDQNIMINSNTLMAAKEAGVKKFLAVLSTCMYPDVVDSYPMREEDVHLGPPANANFSYAYTKRCLAVQIEAYKKQHGLEYNYIVPCNLYGENDNFEDSNKSHFITALIKKIVDSEREGRGDILLFGTGKPMRQFMHSSDLANVIKKTITEGITESFNVAPPNQNYSIHQMAEMTLDVTGHGDWEIKYDSTKPDGQFRKDVSCEKMIQCLGEYEFIQFKDGVKKVYNALKKSHKE
jgi:GDP-L-fucose synthase